MKKIFILLFLVSAFMLYANNITGDYQVEYKGYIGDMSFYEDSTFSIIWIENNEVVSSNYGQYSVVGEKLFLVCNDMVEDYDMFYDYDSIFLVNSFYNDELYLKKY